MKIFTLKRMLGLAAIGGAVVYARKQGGFKNAFQGLMAKKDELLGEKPAAPARSSSSYPSNSATFGEKTY